MKGEQIYLNYWKTINWYFISLPHNFEITFLKFWSCQTLPEAEQVVDMYEIALKTCKKYGLNRYEVSNFSLKVIFITLNYKNNKFVK